MFGPAGSTPFDLRFRLFNAPVTISGWFWLVMLMLGPQEPRSALIWALCVMVSILVHEFGHGFMARLFGHRFEVTLFSMGGYCTYDKAQDGAGKRIAVLAAGPGAQLLFLALICLTLGTWLGIRPASHVALAQMLLGMGKPSLEASLDLMRAQDLHGPVAWEAFLYLFEVNWLWALLNLLPLWPLDGGQITCEGLEHVNPRDGRRWGHIVSLLTAGGLIVWTLSSATSQGNGAGGGGVSVYLFLRLLWLGYFAFVNYERLQAYHNRYRLHGRGDDDWR